MGMQSFMLGTVFFQSWQDATLLSLSLLQHLSSCASVH